MNMGAGKNGLENFSCNPFQVNSKHPLGLIRFYIFRAGELQGISRFILQKYRRKLIKA